jgi:hypothetical protein
VQLFLRKNKQNSIIQIIQIIQSISKIFKDIQSTHSLFKLLIPLDLFIYFAHLYISLHIFISDLAPLDSFGLHFGLGRWQDPQRGRNCCDEN